jgi:hypothetical protein
MNPIQKLNRFRKALKYADRKSGLKILFEYLKYKFTKPEVAEQYFNKYLFLKTVTNPADYIITNRLSRQIWYYNDMRYNSIFIHKHNFELFFSKHNIPVAASFARNDNHLFVVGDEVRLINSSNEFGNFLIELKEKGLWKEDYLIIKRKSDSYGGRNIYKVSIKDVVTRNDFFESVYNTVIESSYLFQDIIVQHPELDRITSKSLNTIRFDTFINNKGLTRIFNATLRFSCNDAFVDNFSSGGMFAGIDLESGVLKELAYGDFNRPSGNILKTHPLTGCIFKDFKIPFFRQAKQMVINAAGLIPRARVVGWDVGISVNGPVLIEGNYHNNLYNSELGQNGHSKNPVIHQLLAEVNSYYREEGINLDELMEKYP